jgi:4-amino-4-deoxy-L-arabinose transferase-like glycosyltransferase
MADGPGTPAGRASLAAWAKLFAAFAFLVTVKLAFSLQVPGMSIMSDEMIFSKASGLFFALDFSGCVPGPEYPPLYSLLVAPAHALGGVHEFYRGAQLINAVVSSLIVVPCFLLARRFMPENHAVAASLVAGAMPSAIAYSTRVMSENLFFPLFMLACLLVAESFSRNDAKRDALAGACLACLVFTKVIGALAVAAVLAMLALAWLKRSPCAGRGKLLVALGGAGAIALTVLNNALAFPEGGASLTGYPELSGHAQFFSAGSLASGAPLLAGLAWNAAEYLAVASLAVFFIGAAFLCWRARGNWGTLSHACAFTWLSAALLVAVSATLLFREANLFGTAGRAAMGRYLDACVPALLVLGSIGIYRYPEFARGSRRFAPALLAATALLIASFWAHAAAGAQGTFAPADNIARFAPWALPLWAQLSLCAAALAFSFALPRWGKAWWALAFCSLALFLLFASASVQKFRADSETQQAGIEIGRWLAENDPGESLVVVDARARVEAWRTAQYALLGNDEFERRALSRGNEGNGADYVVSDRNLSLPALAADGNLTLYSGNGRG